MPEVMDNHKSSSVRKVENESRIRNVKLPSIGHRLQYIIYAGEINNKIKINVT